MGNEESITFGEIDEFIFSDVTRIQLPDGTEILIVKDESPFGVFIKQIEYIHGYKDSLYSMRTFNQYGQLVDDEENDPDDLIGLDYEVEESDEEEISVVVETSSNLNNRVPNSNKLEKTILQEEPIKEKSSPGRVLQIDEAYLLSLYKLFMSYRSIDGTVVNYLKTELEKKRGKDSEKTNGVSDLESLYQFCTNNFKEHIEYFITNQNLRDDVETLCSTIGSLVDEDGEIHLKKDINIELRPIMDFSSMLLTKCRNVKELEKKIMNINKK